MKEGLPKHWTEEDLHAVRQMLASEGWRLWEKYALARLEQNKEALVDTGETEEKTDVLRGRIREVRYLFKKLHQAFAEDAQKRQEKPKE